MSSFNHYARKVRSPDRSISYRRTSLRACILRLGSLTGAPSYQAEVARFNARFGFEDTASPTEEQLLAALTAVEEERNIALAKVRAFARKRRQEKAAGHSTLSKRELDAFILSLKRHTGAAQPSAAPDATYPGALPGRSAVPFRCCR